MQNFNLFNGEYGIIMWDFPEKSIGGTIAILKINQKRPSVKDHL